VNRLVAFAASTLVAASVVLLPATSAGANVDDVFLVGDSVMAGAEDALRAGLAGRRVTISTWVGRQLWQGVDEIQAHRGEIGDAAVVHLGNNWYGTPASLDSQIDRAMHALDGVDRVVWVNTHNHTDWMGAVNAGIGRARARWPQLLVVDWAAAVSRDRGLVYADGTHLTPRGRGVYAGLIVSALAVPARHEFVACRPAALPPASPDPTAGRGYWILASDGTVTAHGVPHLGDVAGRGARRLVATVSGGGYWIIGDDGTVYAFGDATTAARPAEVIVAAVGLPYPGAVLPPGHAPVVGAASARGGGLWVATSDGGVFTLGAPFLGSAVPHAPATPVVDVEASGAGYWLMTADGGVFSFGAGYHGSLPALGLCGKGAVALRSTPTGGGYWIVTDAGNIYTFGDAPYLGGGPSLPHVRVVDMDAV
jgi:hypothetical protein